MTHSHVSRLARLPVFYGWVILAVSTLAMFASGPGQTYGISVFVDSLIESLDLSRPTVAGLYTAGTLTAALAIVPIGWLVDRYGSRVMLTMVAVLFGVALVGMSQVTLPVHLFLAFTTLRILGAAALTLIPTTLVATWFVRLRGRAMAFNSLGTVASQAVFPPFSLFLIGNLGWRGAWIALAFIIAGLVVLPAILLVRRSPESVGLRPDGDAPLPQIGGEQVARGRGPDDHWTAGEALHTRAFWLLLFAGISQSLIGTALVFHNTSLMGSRGLGVATAATVLTVMAPSALFGTLAAGFLAERLPPRYLIAAGQVVLAAAMLWTLMVNSSWQAYAYGIMLGTAQALVFTSSRVVWASYYGRGHLGTIQGIVATAMVAGSALGPWPFAILFDITGRYTIAILAFLVLPAACALAALAARPPRRRLAVTA